MTAYKLINASNGHPNDIFYHIIVGNKDTHVAYTLVLCMTTVWILTKYLSSSNIKKCCCQMWQISFPGNTFGNGYIHHTTLQTAKSGIIKYGYCGWIGFAKTSHGKINLSHFICCDLISDGILCWIPVSEAVIFLFQFMHYEMITCLDLFWPCFCMTRLLVLQRFQRAV